MATDYIVSGRGDLDTLFKPRTSAAAAATGFKSNGGVDLAQRFEPRGSSTAITATGYRSGATDLASIFMDINNVTFSPLLTLTMTAGTSGTNVGYRNSASGYSAYGSMSGTPEWTKSAQLYRLEEFRYDTAVANEMLVRVSHASSTPADADTVWLAVAITGTFSGGGGGGGTGRRIMSRASRYLVNTGTTPSGRPMRLWQLNTNQLNLINGNSYTFEIG